MAKQMMTDEAIDLKNTNREMPMDMNEDQSPQDVSAGGEESLQEMATDDNSKANIKSITEDIDLLAVEMLNDRQLLKLTVQRLVELEQQVLQMMQGGQSMEQPPVEQPPVEQTPVPTTSQQPIA